MKEKLDFIRLPLALVAIFLVGNLILGAAGVSYDVAKRVFSMVILQTHIALLWAPVGRLSWILDRTGNRFGRSCDFRFPNSDLGSDYLFLPHGHSHLFQ